MTRRSAFRSFFLFATFVSIAGCSDTTPPKETWATTPMLINGNKSFVSLTLGDFHSCGLLENGEAYCWGLNTQGQSGNGLTSGEGVNTPLPVVGEYRFSSLSAGGSHTCGIQLSGITVCWGNNEGGQLGTGGIIARFEPTPVLGEHLFTQISSSTFAHTCGLKANGEAWCWGFGEYGQLGNGTNSRRESPTEVSGGLAFTKISSGGGHTCGLTEDGTAYCWGLNTRGQVGDGTNTNRSVPVIVSTPVKFQTIAAGLSHTCALSDVGDPYCWGDNVVGALGDGTFDARSTPGQVEGGANFVSLVVGERHGCGLASDSLVLCWGFNDTGAIGDGSLITRTSPVLVSNTLQFKKIFAGAYHTCGISQSNLTYCWGDNYGLQLGVGNP